MRYTKEAQYLADECANQELGEYEVYSALYQGQLDRFPNALIFSPVFQGEVPDLGFPIFFIVRDGRAEMVQGLPILEALMKKYQWPDEYNIEDGWTPPTQIKRFYEVKDEADRLAAEECERLGLPPVPPCIWEFKQMVLREKFHIQWRDPGEIFFDRKY